MTEPFEIVKGHVLDHPGPKIAEPYVAIDAVAYSQSISLPLPDILRHLSRMMSPQVTAALLDLRNRRSLSRWQRGISMPPHLESRLRFTFHISAICSKYAPKVIFSAWLVAPNPALNDISPLAVLRDTDFYVAGPRLLRLMRSCIAD